MIRKKIFSPRLRWTGFAGVVLVLGVLAALGLLTRGVQAQTGNTPNVVAFLWDLDNDGMFDDAQNLASLFPNGQMIVDPFKPPRTGPFQSDQGHGVTDAFGLSRADITLLYSESGGGPRLLGVRGRLRRMSMRRYQGQVIIAVYENLAAFLDKEASETTTVSLAIEESDVYRLRATAQLSTPGGEVALKG
jgi:hypothetical protein